MQTIQEKFIHDNSSRKDASHQRIALVTGANRGIGFGVCVQLARLGLQVILTGKREREGEVAAGKLRQEGLAVSFQKLDVSDVLAVEQATENVLSKFGRLDVLVNNAGVYLDEHISTLEVPLKIVEATLAVNFYGAFHMCRAFIPQMIANDYGRVVNVSSKMGSLEHMGGRSAAYRISKTALNALTRILACEVGGYNVKVNTANPGWVQTEMGGSNASLTVEQGADTIVWLATLPDNGPNGEFFENHRHLSW
jgi:NAD(P)-dependent dehydrogenase (short-subunit alcohol dehydrogenase family)